VQKWVPVTLLAFSSAALVVPMVILRRYRRSVIPHNFQEAAPPPRRGQGPSTLLASSPIRSRPAPQTNDEQFFNGPLYTLKALSIATPLVTLGATASIWGIMTALNARDTHDFAERLCHAMLTKLPILSHRIYRPAETRQDDVN
ncbi:hypothetical protein BDR04DRAFT_940126, partial [Suillus decipiens]